ncbi:MAG: dihydroorotate dehydrogenase [Ruminococcaceae bacterium]|nr:dihydroorotate dehydrogenase [Oscillospiraceae bacterium]
MSILKTSICGVEFKNPVITSSGTFGFGTEYNRYYDVSKLGGICLKGLTLKARQGNPPKRIAETPMGILNSVGLQNPGVETFCKNMLPFIRKFDTNLIANISGNTIEEYCEMVEILSDSSIDMIEMNISCPNVKKGGLNFGTDPKMVEEITSEVKKHCKKPLIVKLTPNVTDITEIAKSAESGGADALSLINTLLGMKIDINTRRPVLYNNMGGLSGPCIKPVAVRMVWQVRNACKLPIIGMGGISNWEDAVEFMMAGADIVSVGTANFIDPFAPLNIVSGLEEYVKKNNLESISEIVGTVIPNGK